MIQFLRLSGLILALFFASAFVGFFAGLTAYFLYCYFLGYRRTGNVCRFKSRSLFFRFFEDLPICLVDTFFNTPRDFFKPQGLIVFTGRQGSGKTTAMVEYMLRLKKQYPASICISNFGFSIEDVSIDNFYPLLYIQNGFQGVICGIDEMQNWFASSKNRDFPPEMLGVITQNRKNRRIILGTSQVFQRLSKPLREQVTEIRHCFTLFGCLTFVRCEYPELDNTGDIIASKPAGWYWFPHTSEIRDSFDTWKVIQGMDFSQK